MNTQNLIYPAQNYTEVYLLQMDPPIRPASTDTIMPHEMFESTYQEYNQTHNFTPFGETTPRQHEAMGLMPVALRPSLGTQNDLVQIIQLKVDKPLLSSLQTMPIETQSIVPSDISSGLEDLGVDQRPSMLTQANEYTYNSKTEQTENGNPLKFNYIHIADRSVPQRAVAVLPPALQIKRGVVTPRRLLPPLIRFGPVQGIKRPVSYLRADELISNAAKTKTPIFLLKQDSDCLTHIDVSDKDKSNWICLLPLASDSAANVWIYEENNELYGMTTESIHPRKPLTLGYSKSYADKHGLPDGQPVLDLREANIGRKQWWCHECRKPMGSELLLQRHIEAHHKDGKPTMRGRYRCRHCKKTFCRLYTMKRHVMSRFCLKNTSQTSNEKQTEEPPDVGLNITQSTDDNRIPSDESFQNYSNGLDFSTNLFDDRMPSLDISGNSRGENDFNPYTIDREENLVGDLGFSNGLSCSQNTPLEINILDNTMELQENTEPALILAEPRNQTVTKKKKKQNLMQSKAQQFECKCGRRYNSRDKLTKHVYTACPARQASQSVSAISESKYKCEECNVNFKRRGMLVNHLWRVHNTAPTSVPLEKRIRHYPCVACPKIYRTAAKRDSHVTLHHPECSGSRAAPIECGVVRGSPAACAACPRQYGTRAKLLQHLRRAHPHLAPLLKNKTKEQK